MIERKDILSLPYLKKTTFSGSYQGMRFLIKMEKKEETALVVYYWQEPYSFSAVKEEEREYKEFPFSEEGIVQAIDWLNQVWQQKEELFLSAKENWDR